VLPNIVSLRYLGDFSDVEIWVNRLTGDRKIARDHSMSVKRGQTRSTSRTPRETRVTRSRLYCLKSNPDRGSLLPPHYGWSRKVD
jgi:hypothetical protein